MLEKTIKQMKQQLDQMILTEGLSSKRLLQQSQALDRLIVAVMVRKAYNHHGDTNDNINDDINGSTNDSINEDSKGDIKTTSQLQYIEDNNNKVKTATGRHRGYNLIGDLIHTPIRSG